MRFFSFFFFFNDTATTEIYTLSLHDALPIFIERVKARLEEIKPSLPKGVRIVPTYDRSDLILRAIAVLREKLVEESIIVSLIATLFLFHFRSALVVILILPVAVLLSFIPMAYLKVTSN